MSDLTREQVDYLDEIFYGTVDHEELCELASYLCKPREETEEEKIDRHVRETFKKMDEVEYGEYHY